MIGDTIFFASGGFILDMLNSWEQSGVFIYILPFLVIFAVIFGLLEKMNLFKDNRAVNGIIALAIGLMSLQFNMVSEFFSELFPRFGIGIAILLIAMILLGMFVPSKQTAIFLGIGAIIFVVVLVNTADVLGWASASWWYDNWPDILIVAGIIGLVITLMSTSKKDNGKSIMERVLEKD